MLERKTAPNTGFLITLSVLLIVGIPVSLFLLREYVFSDLIYKNVEAHSIALLTAALFAVIVGIYSLLTYKRSKNTRFFLISLSFLTFAAVFVIHAYFGSFLDSTHDLLFDISEHYGLFIGSIAFLFIFIRSKDFSDWVAKNNIKVMIYWALTVAGLVWMVVWSQKLAGSLAQIIDLPTLLTGAVFFMAVMFLILRYSLERNWFDFFLTLGISIMTTTAVIPLIYEEWNIIWWLFHVVIIVAFFLVFIGLFFVEVDAKEEKTS